MRLCAVHMRFWQHKRAQDSLCGLYAGQRLEQIPLCALQQWPYGYMLFSVSPVDIWQYCLLHEHWADLDPQYKAQQERYRQRKGLSHA